MRCMFLAAENNTYRQSFLRTSVSIAERAAAAAGRFPARATSTPSGSGGLRCRRLRGSRLWARSLDET